MQTQRESDLEAMLWAVMEDLADELELTSCLADFGDDCSDEEPCSVCNKWKRLEEAENLLKWGRRGDS